MYNKNEKIALDIVDMTKEGLGVAKKEGQVFFIKNALIGDKIEAVITKCEKNNNVIYGKTIEIKEKSKYREEPKCTVCDACGGCQIMPLSYQKQLELKFDNVKNNLKRIANVDDDTINNVLEGIVGMEKPYNYRNKIQIPFTYEDGKVISGFYAGRTHHIVENNGCIVSFNAGYRIIDEVKKYCESNDSLTIYNEKSGYGKLRELMLRQANKSHELSVTFIVNDKKKDKSLYMPLVKKLIEVNSNIKTATLNINTSNNNVIFGNENLVLYGDGYIEDEILGLKFRISPISFYQINNIQTEVLYSTALNFLNEELKKHNESIKEALDLYCGIGTITLILSRIVKHITGIEIVNEAIINAKANASINKINNADFICMDTAGIENDKMFLEKEYDLISVDPPRKGLDKGTIDFLRKKSPKYLLYISCDSATLSRDIALLSDIYHINRLKCVDMFPHTMHVETVVLMSLNK